MNFALGYSSHDYFIDLLALSVLFVPLFYLLPAAGRRVLLAFAGLYLLYFIAPRLALFYLLFWCGVFALQRLLAHFEPKGGLPGLLPLCIALTLAPMIAWKLQDNDFTFALNIFANHMLADMSRTLWEIDLARDIVAPIGLSFAAFRAVDLLIKTWMGKTKALSFDRALFFGFFPPVQVAGPIIEYEEIEAQGNAPVKADPQNIYEGLRRVALGLLKIFVLAAALQGTDRVLRDFGSLPFWQVWALLAGYTWYFYFNFSGYADIAIGSARLYGFTLKENFCFPYFRENIQSYWNNWHMSLSRFAQRNMFVPLGGYRKETQHRAIIGTMLLIALWHDLTIGLVLFGLYHSAALIYGRTRAQAARQEPSGPLRRIRNILLTYIYVLLGFPLLFLPLKDAGLFYLAMAGL